MTNFYTKYSCWHIFHLRLYGVTSAQAYIFFMNSYGDPQWMKVLVGSVWWEPFPLKKHANNSQSDVWKVFGNSTQRIRHPTAVLHGYHQFRWLWFNWQNWLESRGTFPFTNHYGGLGVLTWVSLVYDFNGGMIHIPHEFSRTDLPVTYTTRYSSFYSLKGTCFL